MAITAAAASIPLCLPLHTRKMGTKNKSATKRTYNKRKSMIIVPFLPAEIIFHILVKLPAKILFDTMRYVCKQWYEIIKDPSFVREQVLVRSTFGICFQCQRDDSTVYFAHLGKKKGSLSKLMALPSSKAKVISACDGLVLFCTDVGELHVANPVTKKLLTLPPINYLSRNQISYSLGCARSTMEYKVIYVCYSSKFHLEWGIITLGIDDDWRVMRNLSYSEVIFEKPILAGKFLHWTKHYCKCIVTLDVEIEVFYKYRVEDSMVRNNLHFSFIARGESLSLMIELCDTKLWEVWVMSNDTFEWKRLLNDIDFRRPQIMRRLRRRSKWVLRKCSFETTMIYPVAWVNNEVAVFRSYERPDPLIFLNVKTGYTWQIRCHDKHLCMGAYNPYAPSLIPLS